jgi:hypothetical protein
MMWGLIGLVAVASPLLVPVRRVARPAVEQKEAMPV